MPLTPLQVQALGDAVVNKPDQAPDLLRDYSSRREKQGNTQTSIISDSERKQRNIEVFVPEQMHSDRDVRKGFTQEVTFSLRSQGQEASLENLGAESFPIRVNSDGKSHRSRVSLACSGNSRKASGPGTLVSRQMEMWLQRPRVLRAQNEIGFGGCQTRKQRDLRLTRITLAGLKASESSSKGAS